MVLRIAAILRRRKHEFSAMMVLEESKSWAEADGDTAEAIDFCRVLRAGGRAPCAAAADDALPRRAQRARLRPLGVCASSRPGTSPSQSSPA